MEPKRTVLIIDDEEAVRIAVRLTLEDGGYRVLEAPNGRIGLDHLRAATEPLVVLLDLMMPSMSGLELLRALGREPALAAHHAFIIFTAASAFRAATLMFFLPGKRLFDLPKPFDIDRLVSVVEQAERYIEETSATS